MIEAEPRHRARQIGARIVDPAGIGGVPAQIRFLDDVLGLRQRAEHAISEAGEPPPVRLKAPRGLVPPRHHAASFRTGSGLPATVRRVHALPWPSAYFTVG